MIEIKARINPISYEKPYYKRRICRFSLLKKKYLKNIFEWLIRLVNIIKDCNFKKTLVMRTIEEWLDEYGESHKNETNKTIHWICVPAIFFSLMGIFYSIKLPLFIKEMQVNLAVIVMALVIIYYASLSKTLWVGMLIFGIACLGLCYIIEKTSLIPLWMFSIAVFFLAWIGQFYGHKVEGKKPSFFKDLQFLMIGPAWLMSFVYKKIGLKV
ncbi:MAG: Mpo1-like protein [Ferruginibacter sp.]